MAFCPTCGKAYEGTPSFCPSCGARLVPVVASTPVSSTSSQRVAGPQPNSLRPAAKKSRGWIYGIVLVIIILLALAWVFSGQGGGPGSLGSPAIVSVSGTATTNGFSTHPVVIIFTSTSGAPYTAQVYVTTGSSGTFSIELPNNSVYQVSIQGAGALDYTGTCNAGTLSVDQGFGSGGLTESYSC